MMFPPGAAPDPRDEGRRTSVITRPLIEISRMTDLYDGRKTRPFGKYQEKRNTRKDLCCLRKLNFFSMRPSSIRLRGRVLLLPESAGMARRHKSRTRSNPLRWV